jgi:hypothetical protein
VADGDNNQREDTEMTTTELIERGAYRIRNEELMTGQQPTIWIVTQSEEGGYVLHDYGEWERAETAEHEIQLSGQITSWGSPTGLTVADLEYVAPVTDLVRCDWCAAGEGAEYTVATGRSGEYNTCDLCAAEIADVDADHAEAHANA